MSGRSVERDSQLDVAGLANRLTGSNGLTGLANGRTG